MISSPRLTQYLGDLWLADASIRGLREILEFLSEFAKELGRELPISGEDLLSVSWQIWV